MYDKYRSDPELSEANSCAQASYMQILEKFGKSWNLNAKFSRP